MQRPPQPETVSSEIGVDRRVADTTERRFNHVSLTDIYGGMLPSSVLGSIAATRLRTYDLTDRSIRGDGSYEEKIRRAPLI
jgi:hypothetical protein